VVDLLNIRQQNSAAGIVSPRNRKPRLSRGGGYNSHWLGLQRFSGTDCHCRRPEKFAPCPETGPNRVLPFEIPARPCHQVRRNAFYDKKFNLTTDTKLAGDQ
jgi:hypothetical protein